MPSDTAPIPKSPNTTEQNPVRTFSRFERLLPVTKFAGPTTKESPYRPMDNGEITAYHTHNNAAGAHAATHNQQEKTLPTAYRRLSLGLSLAAIALGLFLMVSSSGGFTGAVVGTTIETSPWGVLFLVAGLGVLTAIEWTK